jgi:hypothetical protein
MILPIRCPCCHHRARWRLSPGEPPEVVELSQQGGSRRPAVPAALAVWRTWRAASRAGETVVGACPACAQPVLTDAPGAPPDAPWSLDTPIGRVTIGPDGATLDGAPADPDALDARLERALGPRLRAADVFDVRYAFVAAFVGVLGTLAFIWLGAAIFVARFVFAMGVQDNVSIPLPP